MAKTSGTKGGGGSSRVRFIMLDAELSDGDLTQITQAIQNALRLHPNSHAAQQRLIAQAPARPPAPNGNAAEGEPAETNDEVAEGEETGTAAATPAPRGPRKLRTPKVLDLDLTGDPSFASFVEARKIPSDQMKFLTVAAWLKEARGIDEITADHVYTCYRAVKWSSGIDFDQPLRNLKHRQYLDSKQRGHFSINHLGLAEVEKLAAK